MPLQIDKNLTKYIVFAEDDIVVALKKISDNKSRIIFSVSESGVLEGVLSDGDFRRWLVEQQTIDLNQPVYLISNKNFKFASIHDAPEKIQAQLSDKIEFIPLLDETGHLVAIASRTLREIRIADFILSETSPTFIVAEVGNNHNGSLDRAKALIDAAKQAGADCAKFQLRHLEQLYSNAGNAEDSREDLGSQYTLDLLNRFQLSPDELCQAFDYCKKNNIIPLCTPWDLKSLDTLETYGMSAYKVASADLTNHELLNALIATGRPLICSTGMSTEAEIKESVKLLQKSGVPHILLHCNSTYPTPFKDVNLNYIERLRKISTGLVGYSGHERGIYVAIAAVAKGAKVIEKHITLDKSLEGNDHKISLLPDEFAQLVTGIRQVEESMGLGLERTLSQGERLNREILAKSLIINCNLKKGEKIQANMIEIKSPGKGLQPNRKQELIGIVANRDYKPGDFFYPSDLVEEKAKPRNFEFNRPWGLPVRYHDFKTLKEKSNPDFLEFHLSYKDMELDISHYIDSSYDLDLIVHSPDFFSGDFILNLAAKERKDRDRSIKELQRVIDITRKLKPFFNRAQKPLIVASLGGFTRDGFVSQSEKKILYELVAESLSQLDNEGIEIIPQTLPPFPWYFGGQLYLNLFVTPEDIIEFCQTQGYRICLDVSHSKLACNFHKLSFSEFIVTVAPYIAHLHIADAQGLDGEGLQIHEGEIDFPLLFKQLNELAPHASFIPEIWQGHKDQGLGFWQSLNQIEKFVSQ